MKDIKELAKKFWYDAEKAVGEYREMNLSDKTISESDIKESVRHAFRDLTVRTMDKNSNYKGKTIILKDLADDCCTQKDGLFPLLVDWVHGKSADDFDTWHKKACDKVKTFLEKYYEPYSCTWGKAQKIVNMTFKNLYALCAVKDIEDIYETRFQACHVPLDSFTLEWFYRECIKRDRKVTKGKILNWSALNEYGNEETDVYTATDKKEYYTYFYFQKMFKTWYAGTPTPLQAEFVYWPQIQKELAAEGFIFALVDDVSTTEKQNFRKKPLQDKLAAIEEFLRTGTAPDFT